MKSSCFGSVLLSNEIGDPFLGQPSEPERHRVGAETPSAVERELKHSTLNVELGQIANKRDIPANWTRHRLPSPERLETTERLRIGPSNLNKRNTVNGLTKQFIDQRPICNGTVPANDNFPPSEAEAA